MGECLQQDLEERAGVEFDADICGHASFDDSVENIFQILLLQFLGGGEGCKEWLNMFGVVDGCLKLLEKLDVHVDL